MSFQVSERIRRRLGTCRDDGFAHAVICGEISEYRRPTRLEQAELG